MSFSSAGIRMTVRQTVDDANVLLIRNDAIVLLKMCRKVGVELQPPEGRAWNQQIASTFCSQHLQLVDRLRAGGGIATGELAIDGPRKMPRIVIAEIQQFLVSLRNDQNRGPGLYSNLHKVLDGLYEFGVRLFQQRGFSCIRSLGAG